MRSYYCVKNFLRSFQFSILRLFFLESSLKFNLGHRGFRGEEDTVDRLHAYIWSSLADQTSLVETALEYV